MSPTADASSRSSSAPPALLLVLAVIGFSLPAVAYFWLILHYGLNMVHGDQWSDIKIIADSYSGKLSLGALWAQHNENRIFFPNLIVLVLSRTTHFNVVVEECISGVLLAISVGLLVVTHRRRVGPISWIYYCPAAFLMFSFVQYQNALWGFQLAWYLVLVTAALTIYLLDRWVLTWPVVVIAIMSSVITSLSSLQGLLIWPIGLLLMFDRRRPLPFKIVWIVAAALTAVVYFANFSTASAGPTFYAIQHPVDAAEFYLVVVGDVVGANVTTMNGTGIAVLLVGSIIILASTWALVTRRAMGQAAGGLPIAAALICFGLLFGATVTQGRVSVGLSAASQSRYSTFTLLALVGLYLFVLERVMLPRMTRKAASRSTEPSESHRGDSNRAPPLGPVVLVVSVIIIVIVCLQVSIGLRTGLAGARADHAAQIQGARVVSNIDKYPDLVVVGSLGEFESVAFIRRMAALAQLHRLSLFATGAVAQYRSEGLIAGPPPETSVTVPMAGSTLKGSHVLAAAATDGLRVTTVDFEVAGGGRRSPLIIRADPFQYGWFAVWRTTTVPNGNYTLQSVEYDAGGRSTHSTGIPVTVRN